MNCNRKDRVGLPSMYSHHERESCTCRNTSEVIETKSFKETEVKYASFLAYDITEMQKWVFLCVKNK